MRPCSLVALWRCQFVKGAKPASEMWQVESNDEKIGIHMNHDESSWIINIRHIPLTERFTKRFTSFGDPASQLMDQTKFSRWFRNPAPFGHNSATIPLWRNFSRVGPVKAWAKLDKQPSCSTELNICAMQWAKYARNRYLEIPSAFAQQWQIQNASLKVLKRWAGPSTRVSNPCFYRRWVIHIVILPSMPS